MNISDERLTLLASDAGDWPILSALVQDSIVRAGDVGFDRRGRRLVLLASRYRWEATGPTRVRAALRIETVLKVSRQRWPKDPDTLLSLLSISADEQHVTLAFSAGISLRAEVECLDALLEDLSSPWPVRYRPGHDA